MFCSTVTHITYTTIMFYWTQHEVRKKYICLLLKQQLHYIILSFQPSIDARTRYLTRSLGKHLTEGGCIKKLQDLCSHMKQHPQAKGVAVKVRLRWCSSYLFFISVALISHEQDTQCQGNVCVCVIPYHMFKSSYTF